MTRLIAPALAVLVLSACSVTDPNEGLIVDQPGSVTVPAGQDTVIYSLRAGGVVLDSLSPTGEIEADSSATTTWDIGFRGTDVVLNGGTSGPGAGVGVVVDVPYEDITEGRLDSFGYRRDGASECASGPPRAVCPGDLLAVSDDGTTVTPVPGRTLVLRLGDNAGFAKLQLVSYTGSAEGGTYAFLYTLNVVGTSFVPE